MGGQEMRRACAVGGALLLAIVVGACAIQGGAAGGPTGVAAFPATRPAYPMAARGDVVDDYHGTKVADPYRWMEDPGSEQTRAFVDQENALTRAYLDGPVRDRIKARLTYLADYPRTTAPGHEFTHWVYLRNTGLQAQPVYYVQTATTAPPRVLIDPNTMSSDGTVAVDPLAYSPDGALVAYGVQSGGSDQMTIKVRGMDDGTDRPDELKWCKFASVAWNPAGGGFWYNRFPTPGTVAKEDESRLNRVYYHLLGTEQAVDEPFFTPADKDLSAEPGVTDDGRFLLLSLERGAINKNRLYYKAIGAGAAPQGDFVKLFDAEDAEYDLIDDRVDDQGKTFFVQTNKDAPLGRMIAVDLARPDPAHWRTILPETADALVEVRPINGGQFVAVYSHDAHHVMKVFNGDGSFVREIGLPGLGAVSLGRVMPGDQQLYFSFSSFTVAPEVLRYDFVTNNVRVFRKSEAKFDPEPYVTEQIFFTSKDGTRVPMFVTRRKDMKLDGKNPALVNGYGGFNIGLAPGFTVTRTVWLEQGGIFVQVTLRGGNEYGEQWHKAGMLENKQHVFDDFIGACQWLIDHHYTSSRVLATEGGSNGGLLTAACEMERPDLFGAVISQVPVTDMLRYQHFTAGRFWTPEYGDAEKDAAAFAYSYKYSPLHNVRQGTVYPPTLVTTAEGDDRVVPMHSRKYVATLQWADAGTNPILLRTDTKAGHGGGRPTAKIIDENADVFAFLARAFGMPFPEPPRN